MQVLAQRIRWSEGYQAPTNLQGLASVGMAEANTAGGNTPAAATKDRTYICCNLLVATDVHLKTCRLMHYHAVCTQ